MYEITLRDKIKYEDRYIRVFTRDYVDQYFVDGMYVCYDGDLRTCKNKILVPEQNILGCVEF